jgi:hypothetical protein
MVTENKVITKGVSNKIDQSEDKILNQTEPKLEFDNSIIDNTKILEIPVRNLFDEKKVTKKPINQDFIDNLNTPPEVNALYKAVPFSKNNNELSTVPSYLFGGWMDDDAGDMLVANFEYDFSHIYIDNEVLSNRIFIIGKNCDVIQKNWLGTLDGSIVINKKTGKSNVGKEVSFESGLDSDGNYYYKIRFDDSKAEYGGTFYYNEKLDTLQAHMIAIDTKKNRSEFDYNLIRSGTPILAANTFICPDWLKNYSKSTDNYSLFFNDGQFEIAIINSANQKIEIFFDEFNNNAQGDIALLDGYDLLLHMYGKEEVTDIDLDFFYILKERIVNLDGKNIFQGVLTMQIGEKKTGIGGMIQVDFKEREITNVQCFLQDDGSFISFF